jgi:hypothetical protein
MSVVPITLSRARLAIAEPVPKAMPDIMVPARPLIIPPPAAAEEEMERVRERRSI